MRRLLTIALLLLFLWLHKSQTTNDTSRGNPCEATSLGEAAVSLILSPLSLYSWLASTLLRLILSLPALVISSLHQSLLLLLAWPWCIASICVSLLLACLHVALYLFHLALVVGVVAIFTVMPRKTAHKVLDRQKAPETRPPSV